MMDNPFTYFKAALVVFAGWGAWQLISEGDWELVLILSVIGIVLGLLIAVVQEEREISRKVKEQMNDNHENWESL